MERRLKNRIKEVRQAKGFSQDRLAKAAGVSPGTLSRYELGLTKVHTMRLDTAVKIANALDTDITELFTVLPGEIKTVYMVLMTNVVQFEGKVKNKCKGFTRDYEKYSLPVVDTQFDDLDKALEELAKHKSFLTVPLFKRKGSYICEAREFFVEGVILDEYGDIDKPDGNRIYAEFED